MVVVMEIRHAKRKKSITSNQLLTMHIYSKVCCLSFLVGILCIFGREYAFGNVQTESAPAELEKQFLQAKALAKDDSFPQDLATAFQLYRKVAEQGHAKAQHNLAVMYYEGRGTAKNTTEAAKWFRKAAEQGALLSQVALGAMLEKGDEIPKNVEEALKWYRKAAEQGSAEAMRRLGEYYYFGNDGAPKDYAMAAKHFAQAAELGDAAAQNFLGSMYDLGLGVPKDTAQASLFFRKPAELGFARAQANLGMLFTRADTGKMDMIEAYKWLKLGADQGDVNAQNGLKDLSPLLSPVQVEEGNRRVASFCSQTKKSSGDDQRK